MESLLTSGSIHASCVCFDGDGVLILGSSGSGKSTLALACIGLGAKLVGDDYVHVNPCDDFVRIEAIKTTSGQIEVRGVGILQAQYVAQTRLSLIVDLDESPSTRLPKPHQTKVANHHYRTLHAKGLPNLSVIIRQILAYGFDNSSQLL